jgi:acyl-CoA synthetase (NDP forming)
MYGVNVVDQRLVATAAEAAAAAAELGGEVAVKAVAPGLLHKSDVGGVRLHLAGAQAVTAAAVDMAAAVQQASGSQPTGFLIQRMVPAGVEMLVGVVNDPQFGPTVACGAGGTLVELLKDVSVRLSPLTRRDAVNMLRELRSFPLLEGYRGAPPCDIYALEDILVRISALAEDHPQLAEMDCNPVIVSAFGAVVVDARVRVAQAPPRRPLGARR